MRTTTHLNNEDEVNAYCNDLIQEEYPDDSFQWECHIQERYQEGKSLLILKGNHALSDGGGLYSLFLSMNNMKKDLVLPLYKVPSLPFRVLMHCLSPLFALYSVYLTKDVT